MKNDIENEFKYIKSVIDNKNIMIKIKLVDYLKRKEQLLTGKKQTQIKFNVFNI